MIAILVLLGAGLMSCGPNTRDKQMITGEFINQAKLFEFIISYDSVSMFEDTTFVASDSILIMAVDIFEAERLIQPTVNNYAFQHDKITTRCRQRFVFMHQIYPFERYKYQR